MWSLLSESRHLLPGLRKAGCEKRGLATKWKGSGGLLLESLGMLQQGRRIRWLSSEPPIGLCLWTSLATDAVAGRHRPPDAGLQAHILALILVLFSLHFLASMWVIYAAAPSTMDSETPTITPCSPRWTVLNQPWTKINLSPLKLLLLGI